MIGAKPSRGMMTNHCSPTSTSTEQKKQNKNQHNVANQQAGCDSRPSKTS